jgi:sucrose-6-phosphate hydrolase SacC (GH32 family)
VEVRYEAREQRLSCGAKQAPLRPLAGSIRLHLLVDRCSIEIYANGGRVYMPMGMHPEAQRRDLALFSRGGTAQVRQLRVCALRSIWT